MKKIPITRSKLCEWLKLSDLYEQLLNAVDIDDAIKFIEKYISTALGDFNIEEASWIETAEVLNEVIEVNKPSIDFPVLKQSNKNKKPSWDYDGRTWFIWLHMLSNAYGWSVEYVSDMDVDIAIGLLQEILVDDQIEHEWEWQLSEIAYPYDKGSKTSRFKPLKRPAWMNVGIVPDKLPVVKIPIKFIPVGNVIKYEDIKH